MISGCSSTTKTGSATQFQSVFNFPLRAYKENGNVKILNLRDTSFIFHYGAYTLYKLPATVQLETSENIQGTEPFLLRKKGDEWGYYFTSIKDSSNGERVKVDSLLKRKRMKGEDFALPSDTAWRLVSKVFDSKAQEFVEKYASIRQPNEVTFDSIFYYYSKSVFDTDFSFSKRIDSVTQMKLFRIRFLYNERFSVQEQFVIPKREFLFDLKNVQVHSSKEIKRLFEHFKSLAGIDS
ncbi:MAG: hypothetical protein JWP69_1983 [Flaviaesturariibacter sp.]|nr:hypothetical protein [Flaviaesturariibacter sp.]